ncbi:hypothetical protein ABBQ38_010163 [Trebouxia sp. C0009 RCD-2024]
MVGLQLSSGTAPRPPSFLSGGPTPLGAGPALEQLKKTRLKLQEAQSQLSSLQQAYTHERTENTQLKAKIKDDEQQIEHVTSKVSMVETMHDGLRLALEGLRRDVKDVDMYRSKLSESFSARFADCEALGNQLERLQAAKLATEQELSSAIHHHTELEQKIVQLRTSMQNSAQTHQDERDRLVKALQQAETRVTEQRKACEDVRAELSATQHELSTLHSTHLNDTDKAEKQISKLEHELQAAVLHVSRVESNLEDSLAKQAKAEDTIQSLTTATEDLQKQLHAGTEQINSLTSELQSKTAAFDALTAEHQTSLDKCQLLCTSLQQSEEQMQARCAELEQAVTAADSERIIKDGLLCELEQKAKEIAELQALIATAGEVAAKAQETHAASFAALQAELASSKQETVSAKADAAMIVKEAGMAADKKVIRLTERTAKELDDFCKKSKSEAEKEQKKMQSQVHALEDLKRDLEAKAHRQQQKVEAAAAQNKELSDQMQAVTKSLEEKYRKAVSEADQKLSQLQGSHAEEFNALKEKQQLELQQAQEINTKQQAAMEELEKGIGQLKLEQQELVAKHSQDKEALLSSAEEARSAAVREVQMVMDAKVKSMNEDLVTKEKSLQDVTQQLQRSEMSVHAAHMELDSLKAHAREQEAVIADMQEELRKNQNVLGAISKCARKAGQSPATKEIPPSRRKASEKKGAVKDNGSIPRTQKRYTPDEHLDRPDNDSDHHHKAAPEARYRNPPPRFASQQKQSDAASEMESSEEDQAQSSDEDDEDQHARAYQMEKEKRKRLPAVAPKQHVNKRGRTEKPAVTQGRRSKFTAMSAQTVTSDDEDAATCQRRKRASKLDRNAATSARVQQPTAAIKKRLPANGKPKNSRMDNFNSAAMDLFGTVSLDPYAFERSED